MFRYSSHSFSTNNGSRTSVVALVCALLVGLLPLSTLDAAEFQSPSFIVRDPVLQIGGGDEMSSDSFRLTGSVAQISIGTSSASTLNVSGGFLYFPKVTVPTLSATAGDAAVTLSWNPAVGFLGWRVSGYNVGRATVSGGPYIYSSVGSTTSATISGLTNGTTYYFILRPEDAFANSLATTSEVSATPVAGVVPPPVPPAPVGGGGILEIAIIALKPFIPFLPSEIILPPREEPCPYSIYDLDCDGIVGLKDFSIFLFLVPEPAPNPADFNDDRIVDLYDMSGLFFGWNESLLTFVTNGDRPMLGAPRGEAPRERDGGFAFVGKGFDVETEAPQPSERERATARGIITVIFDFFATLARAVWEAVRGLMW